MNFGEDISSDRSRRVEQHDVFDHRGLLDRSAAAGRRSPRTPQRSVAAGRTPHRRVDTAAESGGRTPQGRRTPSMMVGRQRDAPV